MLPGATLANGRYVVREVLGEGAQGTTYAATDSTGQSYAIKRFDVRGARGWKDVELAEREARVLSTLDHPLVPRYIEHFEEDGALYLVMQEVEGETLEAVRRRTGALPEAEVRRFLADADRALSYLHGRGSPVVHRDIKPRNVVRRPNGAYVLVDFGAVSELIQRRDGSSTVVGTFGYMAPEQVQGRVFPSTDVYAVGATAIACLAGVEPETLPHLGLRIDVRTALAGRASPSLVAALERMVEPDPLLRAQSLGDALDGVRGSEPERQVAPQRVSIAAPVTFDLTKEDAAVKSIRKLLWVMWGLGWIIVPVSLSELGQQRMIPGVMFTALAVVFLLGWHKGAAIRHLLRDWTAESASKTEAATRHRIDAPRVRVDQPPPREEEFAATEVGRTSDTPETRARRVP